MQIRITAVLLAALGCVATARATTPEFSATPPADAARLKARTICSCMFVQRLSLQQCTDGSATAIWRYPSPLARVPLLDSPTQRLDVSVDTEGGTVRVLDGANTLAQSRFLDDGGGCVTLPPEAAPGSIKAAATAASRVGKGDSARLPRGAAPAGVDLKVVEQALDEGFSPTGPVLGVARAAVIVVGDRVVADRYAPGFSARNLYYLGSISKVFNNLLAGLLVQDGRLKVSERVNLPQWRGARDDRALITYDQLLKMTSGLAWEENFFAPHHPGYQVYFAGPAGIDVAAYMRAKPLEARPGTHHEYSTGAGTLLASLLQSKLDAPGREALLDYFDRKLFSPIGARQITPEFDAAGTFLSGHAAFAGAEDLARIGMLLLNDGKVQERRVLPEGWLTYSLRPGVATSPEYGAQLMNDVAGLTGCFGHAGVGEQWLVVCPKRSLVISWFSSDFNFTPEGWTDASDVLKRIVSAFPEQTAPAK